MNGVILSHSLNTSTTWNTKVQMENMDNRCRYLPKKKEREGRVEKRKGKSNSIKPNKFFGALADTS